MPDNPAPTVDCHDQGESHDWDAGAWGVIFGVSRCLKCGKLARADDFERGTTQDA